MKRERWHAQRDGEGATCLRLPRPASGSRNDNVLTEVATLVSLARNDVIKRKLPRRYCNDRMIGRQSKRNERAKSTTNGIVMGSPSSPILFTLSLPIFAENTDATSESSYVKNSEKYLRLLAASSTR